MPPVIDPLRQGGIRVCSAEITRQVAIDAYMGVPVLNDEVAPLILK
ncbi:MAG: hypothetical protein M0Q95_17800 [Porticoccaceae bacterium]|nr:hypothetical protein [Porticoccaceae bacterium]